MNYDFGVTVHIEVRVTNGVGVHWVEGLGGRGVAVGVQEELQVHLRWGHRKVTVGVGVGRCGVVAAKLGPHLVVAYAPHTFWSRENK